MTQQLSTGCVSRQDREHGNESERPRMLQPPRTREKFGGSERQWVGATSISGMEVLAGARKRSRQAKDHCCLSPRRQNSERIEGTAGSGERPYYGCRVGDASPRCRRAKGAGA